MAKPMVSRVHVICASSYLSFFDMQRYARAALCGALAVSTLGAIQLPLRRYTTADGLAHDTVESIALDARGYLWFGTNEGLSRFDGYSFSNLTTLNGLPHRVVGQVLVDR